MHVISLLFSIVFSFIFHCAYFNQVLQSKFNTVNLSFTTYFTYSTTECLQIIKHNIIPQVVLNLWLTTNYHFFIQYIITKFKLYYISIFIAL